jgi:hypothetical protein
MSSQPRWLGVIPSGFLGFQFLSIVGEHSHPRGLFRQKLSLFASPPYPSSPACAANGAQCLRGNLHRPRYSLTGLVLQQYCPLSATRF